MCGIVYAKDFGGKNVNKRIRSAYFNQKERGTDGYGFLNIKDTATMVRAHYEHEIMHELKNNPGSEIMFHHRIPTSTPNRIISNHPIPIENSPLFKNRYYLIHNGVIWNCDLLKNKHEQLGIDYVTELNGQYNDSESLLHELALMIEGYKDKVDCSGSWAFIMLQTDEDNKPLNLFFGRNDGSPLRIDYKENDHMVITSTGNGQVVPTDRLYRFNYDNKVLTYKEVDFDSSVFTDYTGVDYVNDGYLPVSNEELDEMTDDEVEVVYHQACEYRDQVSSEYHQAVLDDSHDPDDTEYREELEDELTDVNNLIDAIENKFPHLQLKWIT